MKRILKNNLVLLKYILKYSPNIIIWRALLILLDVIVNASLNVMFLQTVVDAINEGKSFAEIIRYILILSGIMFMSAFVSSMYTQYVEPVGKQKIHKGIHQMLFIKVMNIDLEKYDDVDFYNDYIWALREVDNRTMKVFAIVCDFTKAILETIVFVVISISFDMRLLLFVVVPVIMRILVGVYKSKLNYEINVELNPINRRKDYSRRVFYLRDYAKELRVYPIGKRILDIFEHSVNENISIVKKYRKRFVGAVNLETNIYWFLGKLPVTVYMCYMMLFHSSITIGAFVAMYSAASKLMYSLTSIFNIIPRMQENSLFAEKIIKLLNYENQIKDYNKTISGNCDFEQLSIKDVSFKYPFGEKQVLHDINMEIKRGEKIAVVGLNGAGKSTLIKLLLRFYDPCDGGIYLNGQNIKRINVNSLRANFAVSFQDFRLYAVSVIENLYMNNKEVDEESVKKAKDVLNDIDLSSFIPLLDKMLTKEFDKEGLECSGGQKQKMAIARTFLKDAEILLLDEVVSSLDPVAEITLQDYIMKSDKTVILISHRLSAVSKADRIYFMENGRIEEFGTHYELMKCGGKYAQMYTAQAEKYQLGLRYKELI